MSPALLLDEMYAPVIAETLNRRGHDVMSVAADADLRSASDADLFAWAAANGRRIVTENVRDFAPLLCRADADHAASVLFTSSRTFPRTRRNPGPLVDALDGWLRETERRVPASEEWLSPA